ncbi:MAG: glycosyltransferase family 2 protein [Bacteroidales bacterium]|nr:glycosyltransferase family 2 protein [Bacteroidales bacterium]
MIRVSAVIITFNEERNIGRCIRSLAGVVDEIVVVDSSSTDSTREICESLDVRFITNRFESYVQQKNYAVKMTTHPYVLSLDADEELSRELQRSIIEVKKHWEYDAYQLIRRTAYSESIEPGDSRYVEKKIRLWKKSRGVWGGMNPHDMVVLDDGIKVGTLAGDLLHYTYFSVDEHRQKVERFSSLSARALYEAGISYNIFKLLFSPVWKFIKNYFLRLGILNGVEGLKVEFRAAKGNYQKYVKLRSFIKVKGLPDKNSICLFNSNRSWGGGRKLDSLNCYGP